MDGSITLELVECQQQPSIDRAVLLQVSYVLDTEDIMCRRKRHPVSPSPPWRQARQGRFLAWLESAAARLQAEKATAEELAHGLVAAAAAVIQA